jgi:hypothetical protein
VVHGLIVAFFFTCIAVVFVAAWRGQIDLTTQLAVAALTVEGLLVLASGGDCPLSPVFRRLGDETPFFGLFLPPRATALAVPVLGATTGLGLALLALRAG